MNPDEHTKPDQYMEPDSYQQAWQAHSSQTRVTINADLLLKIVQGEQRSYLALIRLCDIFGVDIALLMLPVWIYMGVTNSSPWTWYLTVPVLVWNVVFTLVFRMRHKRKASEPSEPLLHCVKESLTQMDDQIWLQHNLFWWNLLPLSVSLQAFTVHLAWLWSEDWLDFLGHMNIVVFFWCSFIS